MIPHKRIENDIFANGLRERVTACRKRLRNKRITREPRVYAEPEEAFSETIKESDPHGHRINYSVAQMSVGLTHYSSHEFEGTQLRDSESLLLVGEQEVGIT